MISAHRSSGWLWGVASNQPIDSKNRLQLYEIHRASKLTCGRRWPKSSKRKLLSADRRRVAAPPTPVDGQQQQSCLPIDLCGFLWSERAPAALPPFYYCRLQPKRVRWISVSESGTVPFIFHASARCSMIQVLICRLQPLARPFHRPHVAKTVDFFIHSPPGRQTGKLSITNSRGNWNNKFTTSSCRPCRPLANLKQK